MNRLIVILLVSFSQPLWACAVCGVGKEESRWAFIATTGLLTIVPLIMLIGGAYYIYGRYRGGHEE
jgi:hypothetical protein